MPDLIEVLESFNRKERFFLIAQALGQEDGAGEPAFTLHPKFRKELEQKIGIEVPIDAFVAMDYHLDWLQASLTLAPVIQDEVFDFSNEGEVIKGTQEDVDLLVAFREGERCHLVLVEAKAYSGWTNDQMISKSNRLREIFGDDGTKNRDAIPHFCLIGPKPEKLKTETFPEWMKPGGELLCLDLRLPDTNRRKVERYDKVGDLYQRFRITGG